MAQANFLRDPRLKPKSILVLDSDDEDTAPQRRRAISNEVISIDSESDTEDDIFAKQKDDINMVNSILTRNDNDMWPDNMHEDFKMDEDSQECLYDDDYDYEADYHMGGLVEIPQMTTRVAPKSIDYADLMNKSYFESRNRNLSYQYCLENRNTQSEYHPRSVKRPRIEIPDDITNMELERIIYRVAMFTERGEPVNWKTVVSDVLEYTGYQRLESECQEAFELAIGLYPKTPQRPTPSWISMQSKISIRNLLGLRELGSKCRPIIKDHMLFHMTKSYRKVTSFNFSSGSVVDMALKTSTMKLAIANVATQDSYNRKGNLFHCDLEKGTSKKLEGHTRFDQRLEQEMEVTVNDIKLSNSQNFFISGSDDHKTMIWNAETGALLNTIGEHTSRVTRVAVVEHAKDGQDVFATGSSDGTLKIYALDEEGLISASNASPARYGKRCISSISFGYHHFWDCMAVGYEGTDGQKDGTGGKVAFFDANTMQKVIEGDLGYRAVTSSQTDRSVSCLSFAMSGDLVVCGTSGRASGDDDEKGDGLLRVIDIKTSKTVQIGSSEHEDVNLVDFSPCMRYLISGSNTNETVVFDRRVMSKVLHRLRHSARNDDQGHAGITSALWWSSNNNTSQSMLMTGGGDETVRLWDLRRATEDTEIWNLDTNIGPIARMIAPPSKEHLIVGSDTGAVNFYSIDDGMVARYKDRGMTLLNHDET
ncbi:hypothetical protein FBU30_005309 [Linnemannia zychae]|nr:hypothetical protein FBU30_005309 [Linnemannia zychae]